MFLQRPVINHCVVASEIDLTWCNTFVIDSDLDDWVWRVAAIADAPGSAVADALWSEERRYGFMPCRLAGGIPCSAPADTVPAPE